MEKSLGRIAEDAFESSVRKASDPDLWEETAAAVEKAVLARLKKDEEEPMPVAGQELTFVQAAQWVTKYGSTDGLQWFDTAKKEWRKEGYSKGIYNGFKYRVAPKKVNDPDDPTTWEKGVSVFCRDLDYEPWMLDSFVEYAVGERDFIFRCEDCGWMFAKLATPEQVEAWKRIND